MRVTAPCSHGWFAKLAPQCHFASMAMFEQYDWYGNVAQAWYAHGLCAQDWPYDTVQQQPFGMTFLSNTGIPNYMQSRPELYSAGYGFHDMWSPFAEAVWFPRSETLETRTGSGGTRRESRSHSRRAERRTRRHSRSHSRQAAEPGPRATRRQSRSHSRRARKPPEVGSKQMLD